MEGPQDQPHQTVCTEHNKHAEKSVGNLLQPLLSRLVSRFRINELEDAPEEDKESDDEDETQNRIENVLINSPKKLDNAHELLGRKALNSRNWSTTTLLNVEGAANEADKSPN